MFSFFYKKEFLRKNKFTQNLLRQRMSNDFTMMLFFTVIIFSSSEIVRIFTNIPFKGEQLDRDTILFEKFIEIWIILLGYDPKSKII